MSQSIYSGTCRGGPWDGQQHTQITRPPTRAGVFNLEGLHGLRGSYTFVMGSTEFAWLWGEWIIDTSADNSPARRGAKGGNARANKLSPERRSEIARNAAQSRWSNA